MYKKILALLRNGLLTFDEAYNKLHEVLISDDSLTVEEKAKIEPMFLAEMIKSYKSLMQDGLSHKDKIHMRKVYLSLMK